MTQLTENVYAVEVPSDAFNLCVSENNELGYYANIEYFDKIHYDPLPPGSWQFICTTKDITEKQAKGIVGSSEWYFPERHIRYIDYNHLVGPDGKQAWNIGFSNAFLSLRSLLASKGLDVNKNYALLKKG